MPLIDEYDLSGRFALVATDDPLFGPAVAQALGEANAEVHVVSSNQAVVEAAAGVFCDFSTEEALEAAIDGISGPAGRVDILVNNFRTDHARPFTEVDLDEFGAVLRRNLRPVYVASRVVSRRMVRDQYGRIVNLVSDLAERGMKNSAAYCASQGAVLQLTRALAMELGANNIRVNAVGVGWFTEAPSPEDAEREQLVRYIPLRRKGSPADIAPLVVFAASESCDYTTGHPIYVDGGLMARP